MTNKEILQGIYIQKLSSHNFFISVPKGRKIMQVLEAFANEYQLTAGYFSGIGALKNATCGVGDQNSYITKDYPDGFYEVNAFVGNFSWNEKTQKMWPHCHVTFLDKHQNFGGGHLFEGEVGLVAEISITAFFDEAASMKRKPSNFPHLYELTHK